MFTLDIHNDFMLNNTINNTRMPSPSSTKTKSLLKDAVVKPYSCELCNKQFTRLENLNRHKKSHFNTRFNCPHCDNVYTRKDSMKLHIRKHHPEVPKPVITKLEATKKKATSVSDYASTPIKSPFPTSTSNGSLSLDIRSRLTLFKEMHNNAKVTSPLLSFPRSEIKKILQLYWDKFDPTFPVIHRPTFKMPSNDEDYNYLFYDDILINAMFSVGLRYYYNDDEDEDDDTPENKYDVDINGKINECFNHLLFKLENAFDNDFTPRFFQAALIAVYTALFSGNDEWYKWAINNQFQLVSIARENGMFQYSDPNMKLSEDWEHFIIEETRKRISYCIYFIDGQMATLLNYPPKLTHYEIKQSLPCSDLEWSAIDSKNWRLIRCKNIANNELQFLETLQQMIVYGKLPKDISSYGSMIMLLSVHMMIRNVAQYAGVTEAITSIQHLINDPFSRKSQLGKALNALRIKIPINRRFPSSTTTRRTPLVSMMDMFEATWNLAYIHLQLPDTVITSGIVEVSLNATIATAAALAKPQPLDLPGVPMTYNQLTNHTDYSRIPYETYALLANSHILFFLDSFRLNFKETNPTFSFMFYKGCLVAWQILKAASQFDNGTANSSTTSTEKNYIMQRIVHDITNHIKDEMIDEINAMEKDKKTYDFDEAEQTTLNNLELYERWVYKILTTFTTWGIGDCGAISFSEMLND